MRAIQYEKSFKKDFKKAIKQGKKESDFKKIVTLLVNELPIPDRYRDHSLTGNYVGHRELHINPDWLLIYKISDDELLLTLTRTGSHSDLF
ncbi:MAG: type II toxin-antitoxin system YafQ family toxin [Lentilactobacillus hilgardii]|mgnify:CR=1 FL=1|uniref:type II toxin-antitoxin system RelE/ParE family toxin n=1 Tax=Lactobacillaceae TaxID=33958 RepID=UPI00301BACF1